MSIAYCFVGQEVIDDLSPGKVQQLATQTDRLNEILDAADLKLIDDYVVSDFGDLNALAEELQVDFSGIHADRTIWFDAEEGLHWLKNLRQLIADSQPELLGDTALQADIDTLEHNLQLANARGIKWHLQVDMEA